MGLHLIHVHAFAAIYVPLQPSTLGLVDLLRDLALAMLLFNPSLSVIPIIPRQDSPALRDMMLLVSPPIQPEPSGSLVARL